MASGRNVDMIESLVCPPPPTDNSINEDAISSLIVPAPGKRKEIFFVKLQHELVSRNFQKKFLLKFREIKVYVYNCKQ